MSFYKEIENEEGIKCFPYIGTVFVSNKEDLWANPFQNSELRRRCFFRIIDEKTMEIFFHLTKDEFNKETTVTTFPYKTYFSGAYNQINVCQMRAFGELHLLTQSSDIDKFKNELEADLKKRTNNTKVSSMNQVTTKEKKDALEIVSKNEGMFFRFVPLSYAFHTYERG
jgi:hypothetical protein